MKAVFLFKGLLNIREFVQHPGISKLVGTGGGLIVLLHSTHPYVQGRVRFLMLAPKCEQQILRIIKP